MNTLACDVPSVEDSRVCHHSLQWNVCVCVLLMRCCVSGVGVCPYTALDWLCMHAQGRGGRVVVLGKLSGSRTCLLCLALSTPTCTAVYHTIQSCHRVNTHKLSQWQTNSRSHSRHHNKKTAPCPAGWKKSEEVKIQSNYHISATSNNTKLSITSKQTLLPFLSLLHWLPAKW